MLLILLIIEYVCTSASALALHTCLFFLCSVHVEQSHVCVCVCWEVLPVLVTCHFCVFAVCGNVPVEKALTILMLLISQHLTVVFSSLCFGMRLRKTLSVCVRVCARTCVCAYALAPRHLWCCSGKPSLPGEPQTGRHAERLRTHTHDVTHSQMLLHTWAAHM